MKATDWLAIHFQLTEEQRERFDELMAANMSDWPPELYNYCQKASEKYGVSGDMIADTVAEWISLEAR